MFNVKMQDDEMGDDGLWVVAVIVGNTRHRRAMGHTQLGTSALEKTPGYHTPKK